MKGDGGGGELHVKISALAHLSCAARIDGGDDDRHDDGGGALTVKKCRFLTGRRASVRRADGEKTSFRTCESPRLV